MTTTQFGRRKLAVKTQVPVQKPPVAKAVDEERGGVAAFVYSYMLGPLGGVLLGFIVVCVVASFYISNMRGMGRSLDDSWSKKTIGPVEARDPDFGELSRRPCKVRSLNAKFREIQRELGC